MNSAGLDRPRFAATARRTLWIVLVVASALWIVLAVLAAANFTAVVQTSTSVFVVPQYSVTYEGLDPSGRLTSQGSVRVRVTTLVENPGPRSVHLFLVTYVGWMRDGPAEAGLNESRRMADDTLEGPGGVMRFFRVIGRSAEIPPGLVPAHANQTFAFDFTIDASSDPVRFAVIRNITDFAVDGGAAIDSVSWNQYLYVVFTIDGVAEATSPSAPTYLRDIRRIEREVGVNLA